MAPLSSSHRKAHIYCLRIHNRPFNSPSLISVSKPLTNDRPRNPVILTKNFVNNFDLSKVFNILWCLSRACNSMRFVCLHLLAHSSRSPTSLSTYLYHPLSQSLSRHPAYVQRLSFLSSWNIKAPCSSLFIHPPAGQTYYNGNGK